jgi:DNA (cytosine-5)-methyltransferase 1
MSLTLYDEFAGWGGSSQGATAVPGVELVLAANHNERAVQVHSLNFPAADHYRGDVTKADLARFPRADLFWASPACPPFSNARGERQYFDRATQDTLFEDPNESPAERAKRLDLVKRRALMEEIPRYLQAIAARGEPVLAGVVENVPQFRRWDRWDAWRRQIEDLGYRTRLIALNSMHAHAVATRWAPQSRPRGYFAYWLAALRRDPDWDKWLRPAAWCPTCQRMVAAVQVWKDPRNDMGAYGVARGQYVYRCPQVHGAWKHRQRPGLVEPDVLPAAVAIDWTLPPGQKIGERTTAKGRPDPLEATTLARIEAGLRRHAGRPITPEVGGHTFERRPGARTWPVDAPLTTLTAAATRAVAAPPLLVPAGGTRRTAASPVGVPMPARTTRECDGLVTPPLLVPTTARDRTAYPAGQPLRTQTTRQETALVLAPFLATLRGGGSKNTTRGVDEPLATFSAQGTHHALINPPTPDGLSTPAGHQSLTGWGDLLVPYYGNGTPHPVTDPVGTLTTKDRYALVGVTDLPEVVDCTFRMLTPPEIAAGMAFAPDYQVTGTNREQVAGYGNAVTPPAAEVIVCALVEAITGQPLPRPGHPA